MKRSLFFRTHANRNQKGFSLIEIIVASAIFALVAVSVYQSYTTLFALVSASRIKITATDLLNEQFELVRNLPYASVGIQGGLPSGVLLASEDILRDGSQFTLTRVIRNVDDPFDGTIASSTNRDYSPADYKLVDLMLTCSTCRNFPPMTVATRVSPKSLETASNNGALFIKVFDANGQPVKDADVQIVNSKATTTITINDVTDTQGMLQIVDAPPGVFAYEVSVSKPGFTSDQTHATSTGNPNPDLPHATVVLQQVTQLSFTIDEVSTINISTVDSSCSPIPDIPFTVTGNKTIGSTPTVYKYLQSHTTDASGLSELADMDWGTYSVVLGASAYRLSGVNPLLPFPVLPNATQDVQFVLNTLPPSQLLVTVKDSGTGLPLSGATVDLTKTGFSESLVTGRGFFAQTDWSGGPGQDDYTDQTMYFGSDGNVDTNSPAGEVKLNEVFNVYAASGELTSSVFDTGTASNFSKISWEPTDQPVDAGVDSVRFQLATALQNTATTTWNYLGPDGTASTFYTASNTNISSIHGGDRYFRYKLYMQTASTTFTPNISDVAVTVTSSCTPPGQALFYNLNSGDYTLTVNAPGYSQNQVFVDVSDDNSYLQENLDMVP